MMKLVESVKSLSPCRKNWVIWELMFPKMLGLMLLIWFRRLDVYEGDLAHAVSSFTPVELWKPKILLAVGATNFKIFDLELLSFSKLQIFEYNLFHSIMVDGEYDFIKKPMFYIDMVFPKVWGDFFQKKRFLSERKFFFGKFMAEDSGVGS